MAAGLTGCLAPWEPAQAPGRPNVVVFGDSNAAFARTTAAGMWGNVSVSFNAEEGAQLDRWFDEMSEAPADSTVVVALGANDVLKNRTADAVGDVEHASDLLAHVDCVVFVTVNQATFDFLGWPYDERAGDVNTAIRTHPNWDWDLIAAPHPEWLNEDHIHHTETGNVAYASTLVAARESCT